MSKVIQCVVRTGVNKISSNEYRHNIDDLANKLKAGYTVVMCNKITREEKEWLEYILQKEVEGQTELEDAYNRGYKQGKAEGELIGITRVLDILDNLDKQMLQMVREALYDQDFKELKEQNSNSNSK